MNAIEPLWMQNMLLVVLGILVALLIPAGWRLIFGENAADRLLANDMITTLLLGIIVLLAALENQGFLVDVALALAALSFIGTLAIARFVGEGKVF